MSTDTRTGIGVAYQQAKQFALVMLEKEKRPTPQIIRDKVQQAAQFAEMTAPGEVVDVNRLIEEFEGIFSHFVAVGRALDDPTGHVPWLPDKRAEIEWKFWERYRWHLAHSANLPLPVVNSLDNVTDEVLGRIENPKRDGPWDRRGLVVGSVQSGKTGNYTGLICKALDAGYKLVIILAGMHNSLRSQTQLRTDQGVTGYDTSKSQFYQSGNEWVGVGLQPGERLRINSLTTSAEKGDFTKKVGSNSLTSLGGDPYILIVKKNQAILKNLLAWALRVNGVEWDEGVSVEQGDVPKIIRDVPLLLIDDEADIASINTKATPANEKPADYERSAVNAGIVKLLRGFDKSAYVGYTATPFANIFVNPDDPNDVFPRSFILNLGQPDNYVGPVRVFGLDADPDAGIEGHEPLPLVVPLFDTEPYFPEIAQVNKDHDPGGIPPSLVEAIRAFVLVCAARRARGQETEHNSMLIHIARFVNLQHKLQFYVDAELKTLKRRIEFGDGNGPSILTELRVLWEREFEPKTQAMSLPDCLPLSWDEVEPHLHAAAQKIDLKEINGEAQDVLDYFDYRDVGRSVICIGGDKLSRGLTLEGLSISYYLREAKAYDSLMQMGRWFGYRDGYLDLCRLYITPELQEWYRYITLADLELRREFEAMWLAGRTPRDYGLRVRTHPNGMLVTALNKTKFGQKMRLSYTGELVQTAYLDKTESTIRGNFALTDDFLRGLGEAVKLREVTGGARDIGDARLWRGVTGAKVSSFLRNFVVNPRAFQADGVKLADYIDKQRESGDLSQWTVALISSTAAKTHRDIGGQERIGLPRRDPQRKPKTDPAHPTEVDPKVYALRQRNIITPDDQWIDFEGQTLTPELAQEVLAKTVFSGFSMSEERRLIREHQGRSVIDLAVELRKLRERRREQGMSEEMIAKIDEPSGRIIRELRPDSQGLLLLYPLDPRGRNGIEGIKLELLNENVPIVGFAVSFPVSERARPIEYLVNEVFRAGEASDLLLIEGLAEDDE